MVEKTVGKSILRLMHGFDEESCSEYLHVVQDPFVFVKQSIWYLSGFIIGRDDKVPGD